MMEWQPIETAPNDGTRFLVYRPNRVIIEACVPDGYGCGDWYFEGVMWSGVANAMDATHWMPLPEPPNSETEHRQPTSAKDNT